MSKEVHFISPHQTNLSTTRVRPNQISTFSFLLHFFSNRKKKKTNFLFYLSSSLFHFLLLSILISLSLSHSLYLFIYLTPSLTLILSLSICLNDHSSISPLPLHSHLFYLSKTYTQNIKKFHTNALFRWDGCQDLKETVLVL